MKMEEIKTRHLKINGISPSGFDELKNRLLALQGIKEINWEKRKNILIIKYDLKKITLREILKNIENSGIELQKGLWPKLRRSILNYSEENELENLNIKTAPCCSNPEEILQKARKQHQRKDA